MILYAHKHNLVDGTQSAYRVPFRNTILQALYPDVHVAILQASTDPDHREAMLQSLVALVAAADSLSADRQAPSLDFCTGAKKRGEFIATDKAVARRFWSTPEQAAAYGSNLLTDCCQEPVKLNLRVLVVEDGEHATGDCHAKMGLGLAYELALPSPWEGEGPGVRVEGASRAAQFRLAYDSFLAKGTAIYSPDVPLDVDLIIPLSAFKSSEKPALGTHDWANAIVGIQGWSERRRVKLSYTVLQWFSRRTIDTEVWPHVEPHIERLLQAGRSPESLIELLGMDAVDVDDSDEPLLARILTASAPSPVPPVLSKVEGTGEGRGGGHIITNHPWVVAKIARLLRRRWLHLALGGGLKFVGLQGLPDDSLPTGCISTPDLPEGPVIATRYPVRSWADVRLWHNARAKRHQGQKGVVWMSHETAALVGGDFDGDYFNFLPAAHFPLMATEIRRWHHTRQVPPIVKVKERLASDWSELPRVMLDNTDNMVGLITYFTTQANAMGRLDFVATLAPELQIAVDKFKYNLEHDHAQLTAISKQLEPLAWLADRKSREAFTRRPIHVDEPATDTISHLARRVAAAWEPPNLIAAPLETFAPLFPKPTKHQEAARELARRYGQQVATVIRSGDRDGFSPIFHALREWAESRSAPNRWAAAVWHAVHRSGRKGTGSLAFHAFPGQLITRLQQPRQIPDQIAIVGLSHHQYANDLAHFDGQPHQVTITETTFDGQLRQRASVAGRTLGLISNETPIAPGLYTLHLTWNGQGVVYATPGVVCAHP